jgi:predicted Zn-dependent protease with MMP-like domain
VRRPQFQAIVAQALDGLPAEVIQAMENLEVTIENEPSAEVREEFELAEDETLFGVYRGTPLLERGFGEPLLPDQIILYQVPLLESFPRRPELIEEIRRTVVHEVAHYLGMDEDEIEELGYG